MQINFTGHQLDVSEPLRTFTQEKLERLKRHFDHIISINVTFAVEKLVNIAEGTVHIPGTDIHAASESPVDMYSAVDILVDKLDRQLKKHKEKDDDHRK